MTFSHISMHDNQTNISKISCIFFYQYLIYKVYMISNIIGEGWSSGVCIGVSLKWLEKFISRIIRSL